MSIRTAALAGAAAAGVALAACITVNVYFPEAAIKDLSQQIEEQVQKEAQKKKQELENAPAEESAPAEGGSTSLLDSLLGVSAAYAQVADPGVTSPAIRKIIDSRAARVAQLDAYKGQGVIGENNQGLVEARNLESLSDLKARAEVQRLVKAENADREELYKEIAAAEGVDLAQLPRIKETYAGTLRANAKPGHWIQTADGAWKQK